jgi:putative methionine-R-sulfoxide reductase with GAF domain
MDLYSILGQQLSIPEALSTQTPFVGAVLSLCVEPPRQQPGNEQEEDALASRLLAQSKLTALLACSVERVRYITNASGVALALCENEDDAMVCHASSGPTAPEVGARMYIRSGVTAESMRTRQTLRCDHASTDPRVNQETCKALGIESVMVMPLILERNVVGMFELFGAKPSAFTERDATALRAAVPQIQSALREAVGAGMPLGRIPWAEEPPALANTPDAPTSPGDDACEIGESTKITARDSGTFPIDAFRKTEASARAVHQEQDVPAFLARLADEAKPANNRTWSQWFRPQW